MFTAAAFHIKHKVQTSKIKKKKKKEKREAKLSSLPNFIMISLSLSRQSWFKISTFHDRNAFDYKKIVSLTMSKKNWKKKNSIKQILFLFVYIIILFFLFLKSIDFSYRRSRRRRNKILREEFSQNFLLFFL